MLITISCYSRNQIYQVCIYIATITYSMHSISAVTVDSRDANVRDLGVGDDELIHRPRPRVRPSSTSPGDLYLVPLRE